MPTKPNMPTKRPASDLNLDLQVHSPASYPLHHCAPQTNASHQKQNVKIEKKHAWKPNGRATTPTTWPYQLPEHKKTGRYEKR